MAATMVGTRADLTAVTREENWADHSAGWTDVKMAGRKVESWAGRMVDSRAGQSVLSWVGWTVGCWVDLMASKTVETTAEMTAGRWVAWMGVRTVGHWACRSADWRAGRLVWNLVVS